MKNDFIKNKLDIKNKPKNAPKKDTKKIATIILSILMIFWSLGSIFGFIGGFNSCSYTASADSSTVDTTFTGSSVAIPYVKLINDAEFVQPGVDNAFLYYHMETIKINFYGSDNTFKVTFSAIKSSNSSIPFSFSSSLNSNTRLHYFVSTSNSIPGTPDSPLYEVLPMELFIEVNNTFNSNLIGVMFYNTSRTISNSSFNGIYHVNAIRYLSSNGGYLDLQFQASNMTIGQIGDWDFLLNQMLLTSRVYFFGSSGSLDTPEFDLGYSEGYLKGTQDGYENGYDDGKDVGFEEGKQQGVIESNQYSFITLLGAVIDAPIQALNGFLNFDLLGFNMFNFVSALFTLCIIIVVIKLFI